MTVISGTRFVQAGNSYTLSRLIQGMASDQLVPELYAPGAKYIPDDVKFKVWSDSVGTILPRIGVPYKGVHRRAQKNIERRVLNDIDHSPPSLVYTWGEVGLELTRAIFARGIPIVREKFNCAKQVSDDILAEAYDKLDLPYATRMPKSLIDKEAEELGLATAIFSPSPKVRESLESIGIDSRRILDTSYGWDPARFDGSDVAILPIEGITFLFVGTVCVRKGAHILLEAWSLSQVHGRLVLIGAIEDAIRQKYANILDRKDVEYYPYSKSVSSYYRAADWFIFPSLEEGGPQVTYEAAGCGLPALVSPMGAGAFTRHQQEGIIVDSSQATDWANAIVSASQEYAERDRMAVAAKARARQFTYDKVAKRRQASLFRLADEI